MFVICQKIKITFYSMDIVENRSYKTKVLWDFSPSTFIYAQGHVRKLAALLHVPRAASRGRGSSLLDLYEEQ